MRRAAWVAVMAGEAAFRVAGTGGSYQKKWRLHRGSDMLARCASSSASEAESRPSRPAMNERMWRSPATQENVRALLERGARVLGPAEGEMAERSHVGPGRMVEAQEIASAALRALLPRDLAGVPVLVTAGPTREALDPVRYLSNPSSGRMGFAVAEAARDRGADVTLIAGPTEVAPPAGMRVV